MQDNYIGDVGDYGKYGLLREVRAESMSLSVNWYQVIPTKIGKQMLQKWGKSGFFHEIVLGKTN